MQRRLRATRTSPQTVTLLSARNAPRPARLRAAERAPPRLPYNADAEARLCKAVNEMLVAQRYVDEWKVEGVQRWLVETKGIAIARELLEQYFDRVDQNLPAAVPHVLYDVAEKAVHRDY
jgi:hypothetical protein